MDAAKKLIYKNEMLLRKMRTLADGKQLTVKEQSNFDAFCSEFDKNEAAILQIQSIAKLRSITEKKQRNNLLAKRESKAADRKRGALATGIPSEQKKVNNEKQNVYKYEEVPAWAVPEESTEAAKKMLVFCIADLQLSCQLSIRWFCEYRDGSPGEGRLFSEETTFANAFQIQGRVFLRGETVLNNAIWLNSELDPAITPRTVAHEARHVYQAMHRETLAKHGLEADKEADANSYAIEALEVYSYHKAYPAYAFNRTTKLIKTV